MSKNKNYVALHNHSHYSTLDGFATIDEYIKAALDNGMEGIGLTDHGTASGLYKFITRTQEAGLVPVPGIEFYVAPENPEGAKVIGPIFYGEGGEKAPKHDTSTGAYTHMTVFAYNNVGVSNLFKLTSLSWEKENFYYKPRIDTNMLAEYSEGLIVTTGCPSSEVSKRFLLGQDDKAYEYAGRLKSIFGDNFYVEIMDHKMKDEELERILVPKQIKLARDLDIKIIATNDSHYAFKEDAGPHERILAVSTKAKITDPPFHEGGKRFAFSTGEYYIKSYDEMYELYHEDIAAEALDNTLEVMNKCRDIKLDYDPNLRPEVDIPEGYNDITYLQKLIYDGYVAKRSHEPKDIQADSVARIQEEFEVLHSNDFISYFLVVHDYIDFAHRNNIGVGAGRGSVGGSEIAYVLDISNTDPIRFDLLFERFLSPGRGSLYEIEYVSGEVEEIAVSARKQIHAGNEDDKVVYVHELNPGDMVNYKDGNEVIEKIHVKIPGSAPDVDTDFHTEGREEVIQYCVEKYGEENVANIITFGTFRAKKAFKAMSTIYNVPFAAANKASNFIPGMQGAEASLNDIIDPSSRRYNEGADFREATDSPMFDEVVEMAASLDGRISETGVHPCGVIISSKPLAGIIPTQVRQTDGKLITQWEYPELEALGLIKMDLLGLELINTVQQTLENIELTNESAQKDKDKRSVPNMRELVLGSMDDVETYKNLREGNTVGIFQLGSPGVRELLKQAQPTEFMDIATITALYRPGPMSMNSHTEWAERKSGSKEIVSIDEDLKGTVVEEILADTAGVLVFQESLMQIATRYASMTSYESDILRKAMGKKNMNIMLSMKTKFVDGAIKNGSTEKLSKKVWETMVGFAEYGFNKCAASNTLIATPEHGKVRLKDLYEMQEENPKKEIAIYSMYEDGQIKPHSIEKVVKSGRKPLYTIKTESGKQIRITEDHRMLTTNGYGSIKDGKVTIGEELISDEEWNKKIHPKTINKRRETMSNLNRTPEMRKRSKEWMKEYQSGLSFHDRSAHQSKISETSMRHEVCLPVGRTKLAELRKDPEWMESFSKACEESRQKRLSSGKYVGFGKPTQMTNGEWADSTVEALAGNYLIERGVEFELHKPVNGTSRVCDFYANGLYFEMDGMRRGREYFEEHKYGKDIPFVYMTPKNFGDVIDEAIMSHHIENGDIIIDIVEPKVGKNGKHYTEMTYDIEMKTNGPANFIADGLVSHNSHSVSYAINIYESIYLKTHYPSEFMAALIQQGFGNPDKVRAYIQEAMRMRLRLGPVDINTSQVQMASTGVSSENEFDIVFGFSGVKQMNYTLAELIVLERNENGNYKSVADFVSRISERQPLTASPLSSLAISGAFDSFGVSRKMVSEKAPMFIDSKSKKVDKGTSLFDMMGGGSSAGDVKEAIEIKGKDFDYNELIKLEADRLGMFVSGHPTSKLGHIATMYNSVYISDLTDSDGGRDRRNILGTITQMKSKTNKNGNKSIAILVDDGRNTATTFLPREVVQSLEKGEELARLAKADEKGGSAKKTKRSEALQEIVNDPKVKSLEPIELNEAYVFEAGTRGWGDNVNLVIHNIKRLVTSPDGSLPYELKVDSDSQAKLAAKVINKHKDNKGAYVKFHHTDGRISVLKSRVKLSLDFIIEMEEVVGKDNIITDGI